MNLNCNLVLYGFMGTGKSTVSKLLSSKIEVPYVDTDNYIENKMSMTISEIFSRYGEIFFRNLETNICKEFSNKTNLIISVGGGTVLYDKNVNYLSKNGKFVFLNTPIDIIKKRLKYDSSRPLLKSSNYSKKIENLFFQRLPLYKSISDIIIDCDDDIENTYSQIINYIIPFSLNN